MNESVQVDGLDYRVTTNYWEINIHRWNIEVETWKRFCIISSNLSSLDTSLRYQKRAVKTWDVLCFPLRTQELTQYAPIKSPLNSLNIHIFFSIMKSRYLTAIQDFSLLRPLILLHRTRKESKILILNLRYGQSTCQNGWARDYVFETRPKIGGLLVYWELVRRTVRRIIWRTRPADSWSTSARDRQDSIQHTQAQRDEVTCPSNCMPEVATEGILTLRRICRLGASRVWVPVV